MSRPSLSAGLAGVVVLSLLLIVGCGGGSDGDTAPATTTDRFASVGTPDPGEGSALIGVDRISFTVRSCAAGPAAGDPPEATRQLAVEGDGRVGRTTFTVLVTRYRSDTGQGRATVTETARVSTGPPTARRGLEAKRTTAGADGAWLDLTDPAADDPLIVRRGAELDIRANFAPEGSRAGDPQITPGRLRARCP